MNQSTHTLDMAKSILQAIFVFAVLIAICYRWTLVEKYREILENPTKSISSKPDAKLNQLDPIISAFSL